MSFLSAIFCCDVIYKAYYYYYYLVLSAFLWRLPVFGQFCIAHTQLRTATYFNYGISSGVSRQKNSYKLVPFNIIRHDCSLCGFGILKRKIINKLITICWKRRHVN